jgi:predicted transposase YdaD
MGLRAAWRLNWLRPPALWPLVALTRDGTGEAMIHKALDAIEGRAFRSSAERADHLAVLWFVAEAEDVPVRVLRAYISEERLMESTLYQSAFAKGEAQGEAKGEARGEARAEARLYVETIVQILVRWLDALEPALSERLGAVADRLTLKAWHQEALYLSDAEGARRLAEKIQKAPLP